jgi:hypothetical protein
VDLCQRGHSTSIKKIVISERYVIFLSYIMEENISQIELPIQRDTKPNDYVSEVPLQNIETTTKNSSTIQSIA